MRTTQYIWLGISVMVGILWVFLVQNFIFQTLLADALSGGAQKYSYYISKANFPSFTVLWFSCLVALLIWLITTTTARPRHGDDVRQMKPRWWLATCLLVILGWVYQLLFNVLIWQVLSRPPIAEISMNYFPIPPGGWLLLMVFVIFDVILLFWLPTVLASPRSYRLVVPGAVYLLGDR